MSAQTDVFWSDGKCCQDCLFMLANGDAPADMSPEEFAAWEEGFNATTAEFHVTLGLASEDHAEECTEADRDNGCDCETDTFSTARCDVCGSWTHGERHAVSLWKIVPAAPKLAGQWPAEVAALLVA